MWKSSSTMISATPSSSAATPMLLMNAITRTPSTLMIVVSTMAQQPRKIAFCVELLKTVKPDQICGSTICSAIATADTVTTEPASMAQPANHAPDGLLTFFDHW